MTQGNMELSPETWKGYPNAKGGLQSPPVAQQEPAESLIPIHNGLSSLINASKNPRTTSLTPESSVQSSASNSVDLTSLDLEDDAVSLSTIHEVTFLLPNAPSNNYTFGGPNDRRVVSTQELIRSILIILPLNVDLFCQVARACTDLDTVRIASERLHHRLSALLLVDQAEIFTTTTIPRHPDFGSMDLKSAVMAKDAHRAGFVTDPSSADRKVFEAGFSNRMLSRSVRLNPDEAQKLVRYQIEGTDLEFERFHSTEERSRRELEAWKELVENLTPRPSNNDVAPGDFYLLAHDFYNGSAVHEPIHYATQRLKNYRDEMSQPQDIEVDYLVNYWTQVLLQQIPTYDMKLSIFLRDVIQNNKFEELAREGAIIKAGVLLNNPPKAKVSSPAFDGVKVSDKAKVLDVTDEDAATVLAGAGKNAKKNAKKNARKRAAKKAKDVANNDCGEDGASNVCPSVRTPINSSAEGPTQIGELAEVNVTAEVNESVMVENPTIVKNSTNVGSPINMDEAIEINKSAIVENPTVLKGSAKVQSPTNRDAVTEVNESIVVGNSTVVKESTKVESPTDILIKELLNTEQQQLEAIFNPPEVTRDSEWNLVQSKSARKPGKLRGEHAKGSEPGPATHPNVSAKVSSETSGSAPQDRSHESRHRPGHIFPDGKIQDNSKFSRNRMTKSTPKPVAPEVEKAIDFNFQEYPPLAPRGPKGPVARQATGEEPGNGPADTVSSSEVVVWTSNAVVELLLHHPLGVTRNILTLRKSASDTDLARLVAAEDEEEDLYWDNDGVSTQRRRSNSVSADDAPSYEDTPTVEATSGGDSGQVGDAATGGSGSDAQHTLPKQFAVCSHCMKVPPSGPEAQAICPGCGPDHFVRYCSTACLLADSYDHAACCLRLPLPVRIFPAAATRATRQSLTALNPAQSVLESAERFRQRMFSMHCSSGSFPPILLAWARKMNHDHLATAINANEWFKKTGDYAIFRSDVTGPVARYNPLTEVIFTIRLLTNDPRKQYVVRVLNACFVEPRMDLLEFLFRLIQSLIMDPEYFETMKYFESAPAVLREFCHQFEREWSFNPAIWISSVPYDSGLQWLYVIHTLRRLEATYPILDQAYPIHYGS